MPVSLIVAMDHNNLIGRNNELPWYIPKDLKRFRELTTSGVVVMGRKTLDSIVARIGTPLPNRISVVITRDKSYECEWVVVANSLAIGIGNARLFGGREIWIVGGGEIYRQALAEKIPDRLVITRINGEYEGDSWFPPIPSDYRLVSSTPMDTYGTEEIWEKKIS